MADSDPTPWRVAPVAQAVAASIGTSTIAVHGGVWAHVAPDLPAELAALLASPVTVSSTPVGPAQPMDPRRRAELARYRSNMASPPPPYGRHRRSARTN